MKLNLGCGIHPKEGWKNYDKYVKGINIEYIDLNLLPLPFPDNYADFILLDNIIEHLNVYHYSFMLEIHRILKKGGIVEIYLPYYAPSCGHATFNHKKSYFNILCGSIGTRKNDGQGKNFFNKINVKYCRRNIRYPFGGKNVYYKLQKR